MAGSPERLTTETKNNMRAYYISHALQDLTIHDSQRYNWTVDFGKIDDNYISIMAGVKFPSSTVNQFGLDSLTWINPGYNKDSPSMLIIGSDDKRPNFNNALAIIDITKRKYAKGGYDSELLCIAGFDKKLNRIIAERYSLPDRRLIELNISIDEKEKTLCKSLRLHLANIPTDLKHPSLTAGVINENMSRKIFPRHTTVLVLSFENDASTKDGNIPWAGNQFGKGFKTIRKDGMITISPADNSRKNFNIGLWEVKVREFLEKAPSLFDRLKTT
jgi:hypothetical protein